MSKNMSKNISKNNLNNLNKSLSDVVAQALDLAQKIGATGAEVSAHQGSGVTVIVRNGQIDDLEHPLDTSLGITVYQGQRQGVATTSDFRDEAILATVKAAHDIAKYTQPDPYLGLPDPQLLASTWPELSLYHPWNLSIPEAFDMARDCEAIALKNPGIKYSEGVEVSTYEGTRVFGNSLGFLNTFQSTRHTVSCSVVAEKNGLKESDYEHTVARDPHDLWNIQQIGQGAARKAQSRLGARQIKTQQAPVLLEASVATGLFRSLLSALSGHALYQRASFLCDTLGQPLFPEFINMIEDPFVPKGLASCPYDGEGVRVLRRSLVQKGILEGYLLNSYAGRRLGLESTGNDGGAHNVFVSHTGQSFQELLAEMGTGLWVTDVMGQGVNLVTGDYSRGCSGFWVERGKVQFPVNELTIAGNLREMFKGIRAIGKDLELRSSVMTGSVLIDKMTVGGIA